MSLSFYLPFYFNSDDYVDFMIIRSDDEGIPLSEVKYFKNILVLSDGNGKYNQI